jgi:hypothetical protein
MSSFLAYPSQLENLFDTAIFFEVIKKAADRYRLATGIDFAVSRARLEMAHRQWADPSDDQEASDLLESEFLAAEMHFFTCAMEYLCCLLCAVNAIDDAALLQSAHDDQRRIYAAVEQYPCEYFSLYFTSECYRRFASIILGRMIQNPLDGKGIGEIVEICRKLNQAPMAQRRFLT